MTLTTRVSMSMSTARRRPSLDRPKTGVHSSSPRRDASRGMGAAAAAAYRRATAAGRLLASNRFDAAGGRAERNGVDRLEKALRSPSAAQQNNTP